jgi:ABC-type sugar transport system ATPase subunit
MTNVPPGDRGVGIVFQNYALYPHRTSKGNLSFYFEVHHRENEIEEKVKQTAKALGVGFEQLLDKKPDVLSAGQRQRVALGRCIIRDPTLILLDEPLSNLDAKLRVTTRTELKRLLHRYQVTCVYVTHDQTEAIALGDHLAVMRAGRIEQTGTFWDIYHRPRNAFVAGFVGMPPMNFFPVRFTPNTVLAEGWERPLPRPHNRYLPSGGTALMGVRPEHVHACPSDAPGAHMVTVEGLEYHPADRVYIIHSHIGERPLVGRAPSDHTYRIGEQLTMAPLMDEAFFFDPVTEERIY